MVKKFMSRLVYFMSQRRVKIKPESEISCHITPTSAISGLFHTRYPSLKRSFTATSSSAASRIVSGAKHEK